MRNKPFDYDDYKLLQARICHKQNKITELQEKYDEGVVSGKIGNSRLNSMWERIAKMRDQLNKMEVRAYNMMYSYQQEAIEEMSKVEVLDDASNRPYKTDEF